MMSAGWSYLLLGAVVAALGSRLDHVDVDEVLRNDRLVSSYYHCLVDDKDTRCTAEAKELKANIPDALTNRCANCTEKQKRDADKVLRFLIENRPELWETLEKKYDPTGIYLNEYKQKLEMQN